MGLVEDTELVRSMAEEHGMGLFTQNSPYLKLVFVMN